jgi:flagellar biogenesis protein FliO
MQRCTGRESGAAVLLTLPGAAWSQTAGAGGLGGATAASAPTIASSGIPYKPASADALPGAGTWLGALLACVLLLAGIIWVLRRYGLKGRGDTTSTIIGNWWQPLRQGLAQPAQSRVIERLPLAPHTQLVVVQVQQRRLVLAVNPQQTTCLRDEPWPPDPSTTAPNLS